jgi:hypothetical protein
MAEDSAEAKANYDEIGGFAGSIHGIALDDIHECPDSTLFAAIDNVRNCAIIAHVSVKCYAKFNLCIIGSKKRTFHLMAISLFIEAYPATPMQVDHGKTTLVDKLLNACAENIDNDDGGDRAMDSLDLERERGTSFLFSACFLLV